MEGAQVLAYKGKVYSRANTLTWICESVGGTSDKELGKRSRAGAAFQVNINFPHKVTLHDIAYPFSQREGVCLLHLLPDFQNHVVSLLT